MTWKYFPYYCPFVRGIHRLPMDSPHQGAVIRNFDVFFVGSLNNFLNKESTCWFETLFHQYHDTISPMLGPNSMDFSNILAQHMIECVTISGRHRWGWNMYQQAAPRERKAPPRLAWCTWNSLIHYLYHVRPIMKISWKSVPTYPVIVLTDRYDWTRRDCESVYQNNILSFATS